VQGLLLTHTQYVGNCQRQQEHGQAHRHRHAQAGAFVCLGG
jgi:hypothetical protein